MIFVSILKKEYIFFLEGGVEFLGEGYILVRKFNPKA
jgi:hypothetical protein